MFYHEWGEHHTGRKKSFHKDLGYNGAMSRSIVCLYGVLAFVLGHEIELESSNSQLYEDRVTS